MTEVTINRKLNFVIPVETAPGVTIYVHSTPISREVFDTYFKVFGRAFTEMYSGGYNHVSGPRIAKLLLKQTAVDMGLWDGPRGVNSGLFGEIHRITNVVSPGPRGWVATPFEDALKQKTFDEDDLSEIENAIAFFILASAMHRKAEVRPVLELASSLWGARLESLNCTEFTASLPTLMPGDSTGEKVTPSSIPA